MLKRGAKSASLSVSQRARKDRLDILPNRHSVWLKQVGHVTSPSPRTRRSAARFAAPVRKRCARRRRIL